jgi:hypothetical protein
MFTERGSVLSKARKKLDQHVGNQSDQVRRFTIGEVELPESKDGYGSQEMGRKEREETTETG